jgi:capsular polysaccharide biosynthesis protein
MVENFDELRVLLSKYDFEIFRPESLTLLEELELFHNAEVILGVTGSNLAGIVFSTKSKLVEILPPEKHLIVYYTMSNELGIKYWYYNGGSPVKNNNSIHENIAINIEEFDKFLSSVL